MKNPQRVAELLAELRELAENDFERHRIDVLESDLREPPQVEVIDDNHQRFNGVVYHEAKSGHFIASTGIHRAVGNITVGKSPKAITSIMLTRIKPTTPLIICNV